MYAIEVTDTRSGITEMSSWRFETIQQAKNHLAEYGFIGDIDRNFINLRENKEASIVRLDYPLPRVYTPVYRGHCVLEFPDHNAVEHYLIFEHNLEFFATDGEIMVGPCSSHGEATHEFYHWKTLHEVSRYNTVRSAVEALRSRVQGDGESCDL